MLAVTLQRTPGASIHAAAVLARLRAHFEGGPRACNAFLDRAIFAGGCSVLALHALGVGACNRAAGLSRDPVSGLSATFRREVITALIASRAPVGRARPAVATGSSGRSEPSGCPGCPGRPGPPGRARLARCEIAIRRAARRKARQDQAESHREPYQACDHFPPAKPALTPRSDSSVVFDFIGFPPAHLACERSHTTFGHWSQGRRRGTRMLSPARVDSRDRSSCFAPFGRSKFLPRVCHGRAMGTVGRHAPQGVRMAEVVVLRRPVEWRCSLSNDSALAGKFALAMIRPL